MSNPICSSVGGAPIGSNRSHRAPASAAARSVPSRVASTGGSARHAAEHAGADAHEAVLAAHDGDDDASVRASADLLAPVGLQQTMITHARRNRRRATDIDSEQPNSEFDPDSESEQPA